MKHLLNILKVKYKTEVTRAFLRVVKANRIICARMQVYWSQNTSKLGRR